MSTSSIKPTEEEVVKDTGRENVRKKPNIEWNEIQRKVKQQMGEKAWHELIQSLSQFVKIAERLLPPDKN